MPRCREETARTMFSSLPGYQNKTACEVLLVNDRLTRRRIIPPLVWSLLSVGLFLLTWHAISVTGFFGRFSPAVMRVLLPSPVTVARTTVDLLVGGNLVGNILTSVRRVALGFGIAAGIGIPLGLLVAVSKTAESLMSPFIRVFQPIPGVAWVPLAIVWFGLGDSSAVFIITVGAIFPLIIGTCQGVREVDPTLVDAALTLGASPIQIFQKVTVPSIVPHLITGSRLAMGFAWRVVLAAEMVGVSSGLGYMLTMGRGIGRTDITLVTMAAIGLIMMVMDSMIFSPLDRKTSRWRIRAGGNHGG